MKKFLTAALAGVALLLTATVTTASAGNAPENRWVIRADTSAHSPDQWNFYTRDDYTTKAQCEFAREHDPDVKETLEAFEKFEREQHGADTAFRYTCYFVTPSGSNI